MTQRTFTGDIRGLEPGCKFEVITVGGRRPHRDTSSNDQYVVVRRDGDRITAAPTVIRIDEECASFTTYTATDGAPLRRND